MNYDDFKKLPVDEALQVAASESGFSKEDIQRIWGTESAMGANKGPSRAGAVGDFQIMPATQNALEQRLGIQFDPMDFHDSLYMGAEVLKENMQHFGNKADALRAYNGGWDPKKWDNPETTAYVQKVLGPKEAAVRSTYMATNDLPEFTKSSIRTQAVEDSGLVDQTGMGDLSEPFQRTYIPEAEDTGLYDEDAMRLANEQQRAGFSESALDSMVYNTVTGKVAEMWNRGEYDPNFDAVSPQNLDKLRAAGLYGVDNMMDYTTGARNDEDFNNRISIAKERMDLFRRMGDSASGKLGMFMGGMADPIGMGASMGAGAAVAAARGAAAAGRTAMIGRGMVGGAVENIATGMVLNQADSQRLRWDSVIQDGVMGAGMGALGGLIVRKDRRLNADPKVEIPPDFMPMLTGAAQAVREAHDNVLGRAWDSGLTRSTADVGSTWDGTVSTNLSDLTAPGLGELPARRPVRVTREGDGPINLENVPEEPRLGPINGYSARLGYKPEPTLENSAYRDLHSQGIITELRTADDLAKVSDFQRDYGAEIPPDAKAVYIPQDDRVYVFRDRLTAEEAKNPMGLVMHEVGVHYGLERAIGTENYGRVLESLTKSNDARIKSALRAVPGDTPEHLKLEEALGYLVEKHPDLPVVKKLVANIRNWLRENIPMFRNLAITADDAIAYVRGSLARVRKEGRLSADLTFPHVWHGSPTKGIESLDLKYVGNGEGNSAFGFGHYVTSEKGTALDYRNKEAKRRGVAPEDGGLYRLKVNADPEKMLDWDAPATKHSDALRAAGVPEDKLGGTGGEAYNALAEALGSQRAASEALAKAGIPGVRYTTGRTRGSDKPNSNYVLFSNDALSMEARFSRSQSPSTVSEQPLNDREQMVRERLDGINATVDPNQEAQIRRTQTWLQNRPQALKNMDMWAQSPGVTMSASPNVYAQKAGAMLFENSMGSAGRPEEGSVAIHYDLLFRAYRDATMEKARPFILGAMTMKERVMFTLGGTAGYRRVSLAVAEERQRHRLAVAQKAQYVSTAPENIQQLAKLQDEQMFKMVNDGMAWGSTYAKDVYGSGVVGFQPQVWDWRKFQAAQVEDPRVWEALKENFRRQYIERQVDPVMEKLAADGADPAELQAMRERLLEQVEHQVNTRMNESITDPNTRANSDSGKFETMAPELLKENFQGLKVTNDVIAQYKKLLADKINDRSRTEFDLLREVNGVRLLDYVEHDFVSTLSHTAHKFAGQNAMAKRGFKDPADFEAMVNVLRKTGARPIDIEMAKFAGRSFGFGEMVIGDNAMLAAVRNFTYAAMLGKLGVAQLADVAAMLSATGVGSLARLMGKGLSRESPLVQQLGEMFGPGFIGADYRIQSFIADVQPNGRALGGIGQRVLKVSQRGAQAVSWISGSNHITRILHKAFLPVMAEDVVRAVRGLDGGMSPARMADAGLSEGTIARIKAQLEKHEPNRKPGDRFQWDKWDDQYAADRLIEAMHRVTGQVFNRSLVGEAAPWRSESHMGALIAQFHNYGMTAMEKQLGRNIAINDVNAYSSMAVGVAWSTLLYYSRLSANTLGMDPEKADKYMKENTTPARLTQGMLTYFNMSGIGAEVFGMGEVLFGGNSYQAGSGPVAAMGYLMNATKAANAAGSLATGQSEHRGKDFGNILKIIPGGNSIPGTWAVNHLRYDD